jgi:UrcA family protein
MRKFMTTLTAVATVTLAAVPALGLLQAAHAAEPSATISLVGLNLSNPAHAAEYADRVDAAADRVCHERARTRPAATSRSPAASSPPAGKPTPNSPTPSAKACRRPPALPRSRSPPAERPHDPGKQKAPDGNVRGLFLCSRDRRP